MQNIAYKYEHCKDEFTLVRLELVILILHRCHVQTIFSDLYFSLRFSMIKDYNYDVFEKCIFRRKVARIS